LTSKQPQMPVSQLFDMMCDVPDNGSVTTQSIIVTTAVVWWKVVRTQRGKHYTDSKEMRGTEN